MSTSAEKDATINFHTAVLSQSLSNTATLNVLVRVMGELLSKASEVDAETQIKKIFEAIAEERELLVKEFTDHK